MARIAVTLVSDGSPVAGFNFSITAWDMDNPTFGGAFVTATLSTPTDRASIDSEFRAQIVTLISDSFPGMTITAADLYIQGMPA